MKKVVHIVSDSGHRDRQVLYEQIINALKNECDLTFIILGGNQSLKEYCEKEGINTILYAYYPKNLFEVFRHIWKLSKLIQRFDIIHCHYFDANQAGLLAGYLARIPKRIYTRHHNTFFHDLKDNKNIRWNKLFNRLATQIVAPSYSVLETLINKESVTSSKITILHHPFESTTFADDSDTLKTNLPSKYNIPHQSHFIVGAVSTFQHIKGVEYIIDGFKAFHKKYPNSFLVLANAKGPDEEYIHQKLIELDEKVIKIPYENNIEGLYATFDVIVHTPISKTAEAFGQVFVESMGMGVPGIFTLSGVLPEIAADKKNCLLVPYKDSASIAKCLEICYSNPELRKSISMQAKLIVRELFNLNVFKTKLHQLYEL